jgi:ubiquinone/menaquinone biosynthesis C-methylase UbiE
MQKNTFTIDEVRTFWNGIASEYDRINSGLGWTHTERFETMSRYLPNRREAHVTNVWSRTGSAVPWIRRKLPDSEIRNFEVSDNLLAIARDRYPSERFERTDLDYFPLDNDSQDVVVSLETLEHAPDPSLFLSECHRILRPEGLLILSLPPAWAELPLRLYETFFENHGEGPHRFLPVSSVLRELKACGFSIREHRGTVLLPVGPAWLKKTAEKLHQTFLRHIGTNRLGIRHFFIAEKR